MTIKSKHTLILNRLHQMQQAPYYATAREELALAESTIVQLEAEIAALIFALRYIKGQAHIGDIHDMAYAAITAQEGK